MKTSAILLAIRLYKHPQEMQWLCEPTATLPSDITDLLRLSASKKLFEEFVEKNQIKPDIFIEVLNNFIDKVLFNEENSLEKQLGLTADANAELRKLHYQLLMKTYHPDRNKSETAADKSSKITFNYQTLHDREKEKERQQSEYKNIVISSRKHAPRSFYHATGKAEKQLSQTKNTLISLTAVALIAVVAIGLFIYKTDTPQLIVKQHSEVNSSGIVAAPSTNTNITLARFSNSEGSNIPQHQLEKLLHNLETAYEQGDIKTIKPILENAPDIRNQTDKEISAKLDTLFSITKDRKMLLFDFSWNVISGRYKGQGKFLSRYMLVGQEQWLVREGTAYITVDSNTSQPLVITNFKLENKLNEY